MRIDTTKQFSVCATLSAVLSFAVSGNALAHGAPAAITSVIASDTHGPWLVGLSEGLAVRENDLSFRFVCPASFGSELPPLSHAVGADAWIVGRADAHRWEADSPVSAAHALGLSSSRVLGLAARDSALLALRFAAGTAGTELVELRDGELRVLYADLALWAAVGADGEQAWLVRGLAAQDGGPGIEVLSLEGELSAAPQRTLLSHEPLGLWIVAAGGSAFVHVLDAAGYRLLRIDDAGHAYELARAVTPMLGPVQRGSESWIVRDGELLRVAGDGLLPVEHPLSTAVGLTCLHAEYACAQHLLFGVDAFAAAGGLDARDVLFDLRALREPQVLSGGQDANAARCIAQWLVFRSDIERLASQLDGDMDGGTPWSDAGRDVREDAGEDVGDGAGEDADGGDFRDPEVVLDAGMLDAEVEVAHGMRRSVGCAVHSDRRSTATAAAVLSSYGLWLARRSRRTRIRRESSK